MTDIFSVQIGIPGDAAWCEGAKTNFDKGMDYQIDDGFGAALILLPAAQVITVPNGVELRFSWPGVRADTPLKAVSQCEEIMAGAYPGALDTVQAVNIVVKSQRNDEDADPKRA
ncbi:MAG: hypothetical protein ACHQE6_00495 [Solirubrobacterales bacterium]